jgi:hypothetical protein
MQWLDPMPTNCPACGGQFPIPVAALLSLRAACPGCGASLAKAGEEMLAHEARIHRSYNLLLVACELDRDGVALSDGELEAAHSLGDLARAVADHLHPVADREARAAELVTEAARRVAPELLSEVSPSA